MPIKVLIADDHQLVIDGIRSLLKDEEEIEVCCQANNGEEVLKILERQEVDVLILDINMPGMNGYDTTINVLKKYPASKIVILTSHDDKNLINNMLKAGASGYVLKNIGKNELITAIHKVYQGKKYFSSEVTLRLYEEVNSRPDEMNIFEISVQNHLTQREIEILKYIAEGNTNVEIAEKLFISPRTVDTHRTNIMKKLDVKNIAGLIKFALKHNILN